MKIIFLNIDIKIIIQDEFIDLKNIILPKLNPNLDCSFAFPSSSPSIPSDLHLSPLLIYLRPLLPPLQ